MRIIIAALMLACVACRTPRYTYAPARVNAPLLQSKHEFQANASAAVGTGADASIAFALTNHLGTMANAGWSWDHQRHSAINYGELLSPNYIRYRRRDWELGVGMFTHIDNRNTWVVEIYAGLGRGYLHIDDEGIRRLPDSGRYQRYFTSHLPRFFIQPAIGYSDRTIQAAFFMRLLYLHYNDIGTSYTSQEMDYYRIPASNHPGAYGFIEGGSSFRFYFPKSYRLGLEFSFLVSSERFAYDIDIIPFHFSTGLQYRFQPMDRAGRRK